MRVAASLVVLSLTISSTALADEPGLEGRTDVVLQDGFEAADWYTLWGMNDAPQNTSIVADPDALSGDSVLRVSVPSGAHYGTSFGFDFADQGISPEPDEAYFRYGIRLGPTWSCEAGGGKLPGWGGTYGIAGWGGNPSDGTNGWSARGLFWPPDSGAENGDTRIGFYTYHADMPGIYGDNWYWSGSSIGSDGVMQRDTWYQVEVYVSMNTLGQNDGVLRAWVDGQPVYENTTVRFRDVDTLHVERAWFDIYYGGNWTAPTDMYIDFDNAVVAFEQIGPYDPDPGTGGGGNTGGNGSTGGSGSGTGASGSEGGNGAGIGGDGASDGADSTDTDDEGCGCRAAGSPVGSNGAPLALAALAAWVFLRRRRPGLSR